MESGLIKEAFMNSKIVMIGDYPYFANSISDGNPALTMDLLDEIVGSFQRLSDLDCDLFIAPEAMGIPYATALTMRTGIPIQIIRKRGLGLPDEVVLEKSTGYETSKMYMHSIPKGSKAILVDDVISTGHTLKSTIQKLRESGLIIEEALIVLNKCPDLKAIEKESGLTIHTLIDVKVVNGKPVILDSGEEGFF
jgi:adenine phosphoribosyltransferase